MRVEMVPGGSRGGCVRGDRRVVRSGLGRGNRAGDDQPPAVEGYTVTIDKIGTAPLDQCTVTSVRNPRQVSQLVPYVGPGLGGDRILVPSITSQTVSVSLNCQR